MRKIKLRVRFNATKDLFEKFSDVSYLLHVSFPQDDDSLEVIKNILSKKFGAPLQSISYMGIDDFKNYLFILEN